MTKQRKCVSDTVYGCDECKTEIGDYPNEVSRLEVKVFHHEKETEHLHFCSWACVISHLPKIKTDYFVDLPFLYYDSDTPNKKIVSKRSAKELMKLLKRVG